jgi:hypothetical protein
VLGCFGFAKFEGPVSDRFSHFADSLCGAASVTREDNPYKPLFVLQSIFNHRAIFTLPRVSIRLATGE